MLVTSAALLESKGRFNECTFLVPNAVDYEGFQAALRTAGADALAGPLAELAAAPRPRIGYVGALNEKIDFDLLASVARRRPEWHFVLVGGLDLTGNPHKADGLAALPNVHWTGRVGVEQVPHAIAAMDVCLLPYEQNPWTAAIDSLKLYEYFACGRPVVATDVPAVHAPFARGLVHIAYGPQRLRRANRSRTDGHAAREGGRAPGRGSGEHLGRPGRAGRNDPGGCAGEEIRHHG